MRKISADIVFPICSPPVKNGILILDDSGKLLDKVLDPASLDYSISDVETFDGFFCPGFVNSHCHLELSWLKNKMPEHTGLDKFIVHLENIRREGDEEKLDAVMAAEQEMITAGIVAVGDICNSNITFPVKEQSNLFYHNFIECFASAPEKAERAFGKSLLLYEEAGRLKKNANASITPHAPYSLSRKLFLLIKEHLEKTGNIQSIHHQESEEENKFFISRNGNIQDMHFRFGVEHSDFSNSGKRPLEAISGYIAKNNSMQLVHNTVAAETDIDFAMKNFPHVYWCFCPNANLYIEQKLPDFALFFNKGCKITIGTDSFASNKKLSVLEELKTIRNNLPFIPLEEMLKWASLNGAEFLGIQEKFGTMEKGKSPGVVLIKDVNHATRHLTRDSSATVLT